MSKRTIPTVPGRILHGLLRVATTYGVSPPRVFAAAGLDVDLATLDETHWTVEQFHGLITAFRDEADDPAFGLHIGEMFNLFDLRALTTLIDTSPTLDAGARAFARYRALFHPLVHVDIQRGKKIGRVVYPADPTEPLSNDPFYAELSLAFHLSYARWLVDSPMIVERVEFRHAKPAYADEVERVFGVPGEYGTRHDAFSVADEVLGRPLRSGIAELHAQAEALAATELSKLPDSTSLAPVVLQLIRRNLDSATFDLDAAAPLIAMSRRTLQRRLREEGTTFSELRERVRSREAMERIHDARWSIDEIAEALGFGDRASFTHAFARWTGMTPGALRRELGVK